MADPIPGATLVRLFKGEGLIVKTPHADWMTHERDKATRKPFGPVHGVMIHHTASHNSYNFVYSGSTALPGPLAHAYIDKLGVVWMASDGRANHAGGGDPDVLKAVTTESYMTRPPAPKFGEGDPGAADGNDAFYGFECENLGDGKDPWPHVQYTAMVRATAAICRYYKWSDKSCIGHLEWSHYKVDPKGFGMVTFRADLASALRAKPGTWPTTAPQPTKELTVEQRLKRIEMKLGL